MRITLRGFGGMGAGLVGLIIGGFFAAAGSVVAGEEPAAKPPHVVFVTGDEEYRSEESMPMLAKILDKTHGFRVSVCYALDSDGSINPDNLSNIAGLEALDDADLMVMFTRFRKLPDDQLERITRYAESGKPMMGFRTATHAFKYDGGPHAAEMNEKWTRKIFGQKWITHHGHFGDGKEMLTAVTINPPAADHPTLRGVSPFKTYSWLYHVEGGGDTISGTPEKLLIGRALKSGHAKQTDRFPVDEPGRLDQDLHRQERRARPGLLHDARPPVRLQGRVDAQAGAQRRLLGCSAWKTRSPPRA